MSTPLAPIKKAETVEYQPLWDFGGWGVRRAHGRLPEKNVAVWTHFASCGQLCSSWSAIRVEWEG